MAGQVEESEKENQKNFPAGSGWMGHGPASVLPSKANPGSKAVAVGHLKGSAEAGCEGQCGEEPSDSRTSVVPIVVQAGAAGGAPDSNEQAQGSGRVPSAEA